MIAALLLLVGVPIAAYLSLVTLDQGRPAQLGIVLAAVIATAAYLLSGEGTFVRLVAILTGGAVALAALVQLLRSFLPAERGAWVYPALVVLALAGAVLPALRLIGGV
ncbi:MAG: hypothetical protein ACK4KW_00290 [Gemmobacter sp.]